MPEGGSGITLGEDHDWPDFDASVTGSRYARCQRGCFVDARRFEQVKAAKLLFGLCEGTIGGESLAVAYTNRLGGGRGLQRLARLDGGCVLLAASPVLGK